MLNVDMAQKNSPDSLKDTPSGEHLTFWHIYEHKFQAKQLYRSIHLRNNSDYRLRYPNECRNVKTGEIHPEARLRILKECSVKLQRAKVPEVARPARFNRIG